MIGNVEEADLVQASFRASATLAFAAGSPLNMPAKSITGIDRVEIIKGGGHAELLLAAEAL